MAKSLTDLELIHELEPIAEAGLNQHLAAAKNWNPHDYVPWSDGGDYGRNWDNGRALRGGQDRHGHQPAHRGQPAVLSPHDRGVLHHRRCVGGVGESVDRRGEPARHRIAGLSGRHQGGGSDCLGTSPNCAGDRRLQPWPARPAGDTAGLDAGRTGLRDVPGVGHPRLAPQHGQGVRRAHRRPTPQACRRRREPAHDLLSRPDRGGTGHRTGPGHGIHLAESW